MRWVAIAVLAGAIFSYDARCRADDLSPPTISPVQLSDPNSGPNSILAFAGLMSTANLYNTLVFNLANKGTGPDYDNYNFGVAYDRDLFNLGHGVYLGVEVGIDDRFGNYKECCAPVIMSNSIVQSVEFWAGPAIRYAGILLFDSVRIGFTVPFGLSTVTNSIGTELERQIVANGNARLLYYVGPELDFSPPSTPDLELVVKVQHRSGDHGRTFPFLPILGNMGEGYNANVVGVRYRF